MVADIGTRKGAKVSDVLDSAWINGLDWMRAQEKGFPVIITVDEIKLDKTGLKSLRKEQ